MKINIIQKVIDVIRRKITFRQFKREYYKFICGKKIDYYNCNYDEIISLGYNCEISQRLSDIFFNSDFQHYLYTWSYQYDRDLFVESLQNLGTFVDSKYSILPWGMIKHEKYDIGFHSRFTKRELINSDNTQASNVPIAIEELKSRLKHLSKKLLDTLEQKNNILFILKLKFSNIDEDIEYIEKLNKIIGLYFKNRNAKYKILVVLSKKDYPKKYINLLTNLNIENVQFGIVKLFSQDAYTDVGGDIFGWYKLLKQYIKQ